MFGNKVAGKFRVNPGLGWSGFEEPEEYRREVLSGPQEVQSRQLSTAWYLKERSEPACLPTQQADTDQERSPTLVLRIPRRQILVCAAGDGTTFTDFQTEIYWWLLQDLIEINERITHAKGYSGQDRVGRGGGREKRTFHTAAASWQDPHRAQTNFESCWEENGQPWIIVYFVLEN